MATAEAPPAEVLTFGSVTIDRRHVITQVGRDYISADGLLEGLVQLSRGFYDIATEIVQLPTAENAQTAVVTAKVVIFDPETGNTLRTATGIGDASPANTGRMVAPHCLRMAETRSVARALRHLLGCGLTALEELGAGGAESGAESGADERTPAPSEKAPLRPAAGEPVRPSEHILIGGKPYSRAEVLVTYRKRLAEAKAAGLAIGEVDVVPPEEAPLATLVAKGQEIRRRLDARAPGASPGT